MEIDGVIRPTKQELLALVANDRRAWEDMVTRAGDRTNEPGAAGDWTLRDVMAHINAYHHFVVTELGGDTRPVAEMPEGVGDDFQTRNEWLHQQDLGLSWAEVISEADHLHRELVGQIEGRSEAELDQPMVTWHPWPRWRWIIELTVGHHLEHQPDLDAWLGT